MKLFKSLWFKTAPPLRVFKCVKPILLVTGNFDVADDKIHRLWLYDGKQGWLTALLKRRGI